MERWRRGGQTIESCTILTTAANELVGSLHDRMPVIVDPDDFAVWLDPKVQARERFEPLMQPYAAQRMEGLRRRFAGDSPKYDGPERVRRAGKNARLAVRLGAGCIRTTALPHRKLQRAAKSALRRLAAQ